MKSFIEYFGWSFSVTAFIFIFLATNIEQFCAGIWIWQVFSFIAFVISVCRVQYFSKKALFCYIFIYQIIMSFILHFIFLIDADNIFGYSYVDSELYSQLALSMKNMSLIDSITFLEGQCFSLSDYGYPLFLRIIYIIGNSVENSMRLLIIVNSLFQTLVAMMMYNIGEKLFEDNRRIKVAVALWGFNTASIFLNVSGLKEPLFLFLCLFAVFSLYKITDKRILIWHFVFFLLVLLIWLFRYYMSLFFVIIYLGCVVFPFVYKKYFNLVCIISIVTCIGFTSLLIKYFPEIYYAQLKVDEFNEQHGILFQLNSYLLSFFAPIPKFFELEFPQNLIFVVYSIEKFFLSIWGVVGSYYIIKNKLNRFFPLISIVLFTVLMTIVSNHTIDYRYPYVIMPCYFLLIIAGTYYEVKWLNRVYFVYAVLIVVLFNLRLF